MPRASETQQAERLNRARVIAGGYDDAVTAFTSVAARKFASPSCQQVRALSSRFSGSGCPEAEGTRLSGERVITRADSFHSASTSTSRRTRPLKSQGIDLVAGRWI